MSQVEATRGEIRPLLLASCPLLLAFWPRPLAAPDWERRQTPEPPVRGKRHPAEDGRLHPRRQNHLRAQQANTGGRQGARNGVTASTDQKPKEPRTDIDVAKSLVQPSIMMSPILNLIHPFCYVVNETSHCEAVVLLDVSQFTFQTPFYICWGVISVTNRRRHRFTSVRPRWCTSVGLESRF